MNYLALTIGPLYETQKYCKKTRELWVGSYFFSYFMRTLIGKLIKDGVKLIIPYVDDKQEVLSKYREEGIFHDRFIATSNESKEDIKDLIEDSIDSTLEQVIVDLDIEDGHYEALKNYLQYSYVIGTEDELKNESNKENVIFAIDAILDSMELQYSFDNANSTKVCKVDDKDYSIAREGLATPLAKLQYEAKEMKNLIESTHFGFKSIPKIAVSNIFEKLDNDSEYKPIVKKLEEDEEKFWRLEDDPYDIFYRAIDRHPEFKPHHKYYAVIYADGDKMGTTIRNIYNREDKDIEIKNFSKKLYEYISHDAKDDGETSLYRVIDDFGGMLIFAGGDDILAFAPVFGKDGRTIFDLLEELSKRFTDAMGDDVSLSFGLNINYYKYPMIEAIDEAHKLLARAKKNNTKEKSGSVALSLTKHSGQSFDATFLLNDDAYKMHRKLFKDELIASKDTALPHNIQYALKNSEYLICEMYKNHSVEEAHTRLDALFTNSIKDESHSSQATTALDSLKEYIKVIQPKEEEDFKKLISQLAIIKFLRRDK